MAEMSLAPFLHPSMKMPVEMGNKQMSLKVDPAHSIGDLMDDVEDLLDQLFEKEGHDLQFSYNVVWNVKDQQKALVPENIIGDHFVDGDVFGVYGDILPKPKPRIPNKDKIPVVILTGFLGSGKTTLLNYMLSEQREKKIAVIENEFGEISIDDALLKTEKKAVPEKIVMMDNGCLCCSLRGDLENALGSILDEVTLGAKFDLIAIETTGMADPVPIVRTFMANPNLTDFLRLDGVVTVADAKHLPGRLDDDIEKDKINEAYQQIAFADKIILNKLDLITTEQAIAVKDQIRSINKFAKILPAVKSRIKLDELTQMRAHDLSHFAEIELETEAEVAPEFKANHDGHSGGGHGGEAHGSGHGDETHVSGLGHDVESSTEQPGHGGTLPGNGDGHGADEGTGHGAGHGAEARQIASHSPHDTRVNSFSIVREGEIIPALFRSWMEHLCSLPPEKGTIFRIKGIFAIKGFPIKKVFHSVMDSVDEADAGQWKEGERKLNKIVFIGKGMNQQLFRDGFEAMFDDAVALKKRKLDDIGSSEETKVG